MYINDDEFQERLSSPDNLLNRLEIKKLHNGGRRPGNKNIPQMIRETIAVCAKEDGSIAAGKAFGVSQSRAHQYSQGIVSHHLGVNSDFKRNIDSQVKDKEEQAHNSALDALLQTIGIVNDKVSDISSPKLASKIASDMSRVVAAIRPKSESGLNVNANQVVIYAPEQRHIATYETVDISEK